jgi:hypothetical protein
MERIPLLRFPETAKLRTRFAGAKLDDLNRAISECRNKQPLPRQIDGHMVDAPSTPAREMD